MGGLTLAAAASIAIGVSVGAAATVGATLSLDAADMPAPAQARPAPSGPLLVQYGDRCIHGHCLPCDSKESCLERLPPELRP